MRTGINSRIKSLCIFLAFIFVFNGIVILNSRVHADDLTIYDGDELKGWELDCYWANGRKDIGFTSYTDEYVDVKLTVEYYAPISAITDDLPPGTVSFSIPDIGGARRSGAPFKPATAVDGVDSIWEVEYALESESYVFSNKVTIEKNKPISGGFEVLWQLRSRECRNDYVMECSPLFRIKNDATNMSPLLFTLETKRDFYNISLTRDILSYIRTSQNDYKLFGTGNTRAEKAFDFTDISSREGFGLYTDGVKAVYVRIKSVRADRDYRVSINVDVCFHFHEGTSRVLADGSNNAYITNVSYMRAFINGSDVNCCASGADTFDEQVTENAIVRRVWHTDTEKTASASLIKYDRDGTTPLANAWFALEKKTSSDTWTTVSGYEYIKTARDGRVEAEGLKFGTYRFNEIIAPVGYIIDDNDRYTDEIVLDASTAGTIQTVTKTNERISGSATLRKYSDDGIPLNGARFDLYLVNGEIDPAGRLVKGGSVTESYAGAPEGDPADAAIRLGMETVTVNGQAGMLPAVTGLDWGRYYFKEFSSPGGYERDETVYCFEITAENAAVIYDAFKPENARRRGEVILNKVAGERVTVGAHTFDTGDPVPGAVFSLHTSDGAAVRVKPKTKTVTDPATGDENTINCFTVCGNADPDGLESVTADENGQIRVDGIEWGSSYFEETEAPEGFALGEKVRFTVNASSCLAVQELDCEDFAMKCLIRIDKEIDTKLGVFGTPTFTFKVTETVSGADYTRMITLSGNSLTGSAVVQVPVGLYRVEEIPVNRYELVGTTYVAEGTTVPEENRSVRSGVFTFSLSSEAGKPQTAEVKFINSLDDYTGISHTAAVNNIIPSKRRMTGFSLELKDEFIECSRNSQNEYIITKDMLTGTISYDDGTSEPMDDAMLAAIAPESWTLDNGFANAGQSFLLNAQYGSPDSSRIYRTSFTATVGPYKVIESQKVIFRSDSDNTSIFRIGTKQSGVNTVYYNDNEEGTAKTAVSGSYIVPEVMQEGKAFLNWHIVGGEDDGMLLPPPIRTRTANTG